MSKVSEPIGLGATGKDLWKRLTGKYEFRPDELTVVERAARTADRLAAMEETLGGAITATGSMGQTVVHPLIPEIRSHTQLLASLMKQLNLPDDEAAAGESSRSTQARKAAQSRWAVAHGASA